MYQNLSYIANSKPQHLDSFCCYRLVKPGEVWQQIDNLYLIMIIIHPQRGTCCDLFQMFNLSTLDGLIITREYPYTYCVREQISTI